LLIQTGIGLHSARLITQRLLKCEPWDVVISTGFAGALNCLPIGSLVIGHEVLVGQSADLLPDADSPRIECDPDWVNAALNIRLMTPSPLRRGRIVTVNRVLTRAYQKDLLGKRTGALAVDMESGAIGQVAQQHGFPFLIVRAISDGVNEDLPVDFNVFLKPSGWLLGAKNILSTPRCWNGFFRLYRNSKQAGIQLSNFFEEFLVTHFKVVSPLRTLRLTD
jgi:adenosylhomocysteine nucleosidase